MAEYIPESNGNEEMSDYESDTLILKDIEEWDMVNVRRLREMIGALCDGRRVDMTDLPSAPEYMDRLDRISGDGVWACDHNGMCLCGAAADDVQYIAHLEDSILGEGIY